MENYRIVAQAPLEDFPGYEIHYCKDWEIQGRIWSKISDRYLAALFNSHGYAKTNLKKDRKMINFFLHRLLVQHFLPEIWDPEMVVNHKDYDRTNNRLENLEMVSRSMNSSDQNKSGLSSKYHGVSLDRTSWRAYVCQESKKVWDKCFSTEKEAARARNEYIIENELDLKLNEVSDDEE